VLDYWAVAIDHDAQDQRREGAPSARVDVNAPNSPPNPPASLVLAKDAQGDTVLEWTPADVLDPDGDPIHSYVIYRDGTSIADRYIEITGDQTQAMDHTTGGTTHDYWIASVDSRFSESALLGPVSG
jgi:hypothetical protein